MTSSFYSPARRVAGPAYGKPFKLVSTLFILALAAYGLQVGLRYSPAQLGAGTIAVLGCAALLLGACCYWFLQSTITIDDKGIAQTWLVDRKVEWRDIRGAKMVGIPYLHWLIPPRLLVRTGNSFMAFTGGSREVLVEFARITLAYQMNK